MTAMAADPETQRWWEVCIPRQERLPTTADGEQWAPMVEAVVHRGLSLSRAA